MAAVKLVLTIIVFGGAFSFTQLDAQITPTNNLIGVDINYPQNSSFNYDSCFALGATLGMSTVGIYQNWTAFEVSPNSYNMTIIDIANIYYPAHHISIDLTIAPIHTNNLEVPSDLTSIPFDDLILINRFKKLLDTIHVHSPNLVLNSLVIGSEHDIYIGSNATLWAQYTTFYNAVSDYARTLWPGLHVATELTFGGITTHNSFAQTLNANSDYIGISYYPLNNDFTVKPVSTIPKDFATLVGLYPLKPLCFYQYGYPSSLTCSSSESLQAQFIAQTFSTWDNYSSNIKLIDFTWLHDLDAATVNFYATYYGLTDPIFLEYLRTLGLRTWSENGTNKVAFSELQCQAKQRGYNNLSIACTTGVVNIAEATNTLTIFPNPFSFSTTLHTDILLKNVTLTVYSSHGQLVAQIKNINKQTVTISRDDLASGLYLVHLTQDNKVIGTRKLLIED